MKDLTKEQLQKEIIKTRQEYQLTVMMDLYDRVEHLGNKAIKNTYIPSQEERIVFGEIVKLINGMNKWF